MGWQISGLGKIVRFSKHWGLPLVRDDAAETDIYTVSAPGISAKLVPFEDLFTRYRPERESFIEVDAQPGPFTINKRNGATYYFDQSVGQHTWLLTRMVDRNGNQITFSWDEDGGLERITRIEYAGRSIDFEYEDSPVQRISFAHGTRR